MVPHKTPTFAVVRFGDYLTEDASHVSHLVAVVKVLLDAEAEGQRLNELKG